MKSKGFFYQFIIFLALAGLIVVTGCKKDNKQFSVNYGYNYYPVDSGHYIIYNVDSVTFNYDQINYTRDTSRYQMQAFFGDTLHDLLDSVNFRLYYSTRADSNSSWGSPYETYGLRVTTNLQVVENDIRFIKLIFPPQAAEQWMGNLYVPTTGAYTTYQGWNYYFENIDTTVVISGQTYNNAIVVSEVNNVSLISKIVRTEIYAPNVGMIYQEWEALSKQNVILGWDTGAESGFSIHMWAVAHNP